MFAGNDADEFNAVLKQHITPEILITTCRFNSGRGPAFIDELMQVIPNSQYVKRGTYELKKIMEYAKNRDFTSFIVVHTNRREPVRLHFGLLFTLQNHGNPTSHKPELVLNNFTTRLGHRVGRMIQQKKRSVLGAAAAAKGQAGIHADDVWTNGIVIDIHRDMGLCCFDDVTELMLGWIYPEIPVFTGVLLGCLLEIRSYFGAKIPGD
ncbi:hypothetical protein ACJX0J_021354 [Zea mays]